MQGRLMGTAAGNPKAPPAARVPLRSLLSRNIQNLLMAGRCISSSYTVQGSLRVAGTAVALGQTAGLAAAAVARSSASTISEGEEPGVASTIRAALDKGL